MCLPGRSSDLARWRTWTMCIHTAPWQRHLLALYLAPWKKMWAVVPDLNLRPVFLDRGPFWGQQHAKPCLKEKKRQSLSSLGKIWLLSCPPKLCFLPLWLWCLVSHVWFFATSWTVACQALLSLGFSRQEYWNGLSFPPPSVSLHAWRKID